MKRFPTLFVSHGAPTFALEPGLAGPHLRRLAQALPRPQAVLVVSAHWMTRELNVATSPRPPTIHDFGGFPAELYRIEYAAPGHPQLAKQAGQLLQAAGYRVDFDERRGLDHGAWVPLLHLYPAADVPAFQVSLPARFDAAAAWKLGQDLAPLAEKNVLIMGSGSLTHNLHEVRPSHGDGEPYALEFVEWVRAAVVSGDRSRLARALELAPHAARAHPTPEHFLPLLVAAGAAAPDAPATVLAGGMTYGVISMESYVFGQTPSFGSFR